MARVVSCNPFKDLNYAFTRLHLFVTRLLKICTAFHYLNDVIFETLFIHWRCWNNCFKKTILNALYFFIMMRKAEKEIMKICWEISEVKWMVPFLSSLGLIFRFYFTINFIYIWWIKGSHKVARPITMRGEAKPVKSLEHWLQNCFVCMLTIKC